MPLAPVSRCCRAKHPRPSQPLRQSLERFGRKQFGCLPQQWTFICCARRCLSSAAEQSHHPFHIERRGSRGLGTAATGTGRSHRLEGHRRNWQRECRQHRKGFLQMLQLGDSQNAVVLPREQAADRANRL